MNQLIKDWAALAVIILAAIGFASKFGSLSTSLESAHDRISEIEKQTKGEKGEKGEPGKMQILKTGGGTQPNENPKFIAKINDLKTPAMLFITARVQARKTSQGGTSQAGVEIFITLNGRKISSNQEFEGELNNGIFPQLSHRDAVMKASLSV